MSESGFWFENVGGFCIGFIAGPACYFGARLKHRLGYDDALDAFGIHAIAGSDNDWDAREVTYFECYWHHFYKYTRMSGNTPYWILRHRSNRGSWKERSVLCEGQWRCLPPSLPSLRSSIYHRMVFLLYNFYPPFSQMDYWSESDRRGGGEGSWQGFAWWNSH